MVNRNENQAEFVIQAGVLMPARPDPDSDREDLAAQQEPAAGAVNANSGHVGTRTTTSGDIHGGLSL